MNELNNKTNNQHWFKIGDIFIDEHAKKIGAIATAIYVCLKRHANRETRIAFPSHELISRELNISSRTVIRHTHVLESYGMIKKESVKKKGRWPNNKYFLTYSRDWLNRPCDLKSHSTNYLYDKKNKNHVTKSHIKENNINRDNSI